MQHFHEKTNSRSLVILYVNIQGTPTIPILDWKASCHVNQQVLQSDSHSILFHNIERIVFWTGCFSEEVPIMKMWGILSRVYIEPPLSLVGTTFGWSSVKIGTIQRRLAWSLRKDDTHTLRKYHDFLTLSFHSSSFLNPPVLSVAVTRWMLPFAPSFLVDCVVYLWEEGNRNRFKEGSFNLDLTYITDRYRWRVDGT